MTKRDPLSDKPSSEKPLSEKPWSVPVALHEVSETGRHLQLAADERARAAVAKLAGLRAVPRLDAVFDLAPRGRDGLRVAGRVSATVEQTCVVTLEPVENEIDEEIDLVFAPTAVAASLVDRGVAEDGVEPLIGGVVDLGVLATEFLILGIDPYPRKPDAVFEGPSVGDASVKPFAALAALKKGQSGTQGG
jgi:uncharacterized metal-binding protein YceD (DUF177 family)